MSWFQKFICFLLCCITSTASAWGPVGHETIGYIAEDNLTPAAQRSVRELLGTESLADVANWADQVRMFGRPKTAPWHFIDLPVRERITAADMPRFCPNHDCVVDQIEVEVAVLKSRSSTKAAKIEALKFLVHLVGDLHQPLHCADDHDRGGNEKLVRFRSTPRSKGTKLKLHALWDHLGEVRITANPRDLATRLRLHRGQKQKFAQGSVLEWAWESHLIARDVVYAGFLGGPTSDSAGVSLPIGYPMRGVVFTQLQRAGVRLAVLLNEVFGR